MWLSILGAIAAMVAKVRIEVERDVDDDEDTAKASKSGDRKEAQIVIEEWRHRYNTKRPYSALGDKPPAPENIIHLHERPTMNQHSNRTSQTMLIKNSRRLKSFSVRKRSWQSKIRLCS